MADGCNLCCTNKNWQRYREQSAQIQTLPGKFGSSGLTKIYKIALLFNFRSQISVYSIWSACLDSQIITGSLVPRVFGHVTTQAINLKRACDVLCLILSPPPCRMLKGDRSLMVQWMDVNQLSQEENLHSKCLCVDRLPLDLCDSEELTQIFSETYKPIFCQVKLWNSAFWMSIRMFLNTRFILCWECEPMRYWQEGSRIRRLTSVERAQRRIGRVGLVGVNNFYGWIST